MHDFVLQDFTTIRGYYNVTVTQGEDDWLDLEDYEDLSLWADIREVTFATGMTSITVALQTAPIKDESLFLTIGGGSGYSQTSTTPPSAPIAGSVVLAQNSAGTPLGRYLRWRLIPVGGTAGSWDMTFRIVVCANRVGGNYRKKVAGAR